MLYTVTVVAGKLCAGKTPATFGVYYAAHFRQRKQFMTVVFPLNWENVPKQIWGETISAFYKNVRCGHTLLGIGYRDT